MLCVFTVLHDVVLMKPGVGHGHISFLLTYRKESKFKKQWLAINHICHSTFFFFNIEHTWVSSIVFYGIPNQGQGLELFFIFFFS